MRPPRAHVRSARHVVRSWLRRSWHRSFTSDRHSNNGRSSISPRLTHHHAASGAGNDAGGHSSSLRGLLKVSEEVQEALRANRPVVALESTIYTHGAIGSDLQLEDIVRDRGATPAVIGILGGVPTIGLTPDEVGRMVSEGAKKVSRRDLAYLAGMGILGSPIHGGTTVAGTMLLARLAGIRVFGTGGLGGVHRGWESTMDISADLTELGKTRVAVVASGSKGFLDIPATLEYLETQGVLVSTFADGRADNDVTFPAFWARESGIMSPSVVHTEKEAAAMILAQERLGIEAGLLFANPIPEEFAIPRRNMDAAIDQAVAEATERGFSGNENTPYILKRIRELTRGRSVPANIALVKANVARAATIAVELSQLSGDGRAILFQPALPARDNQSRREHSHVQAAPAAPAAPLAPLGKVPKPLSAAEPFGKASNPILPDDQVPSKVDVLVAGSVALDLSCDLAVQPNGDKANSNDDGTTSPMLHTSNPAHIRQTVGGVGHNVALAAHRVSRMTKVRLCSLVGDDVAGATILSQMNSCGMDTTCIRQLGNEYNSARTAQYVAVNDSAKNLVVAMADMDILTSNGQFKTYWGSAVTAAKPDWLVVDANWSKAAIRGWIKNARSHGAKVAYEPVSVHKAPKLFGPVQYSEYAGLLHPTPFVDMATPNSRELAAMYGAAREKGYFDCPQWFTIIDSFGMKGMRDRFVDLTSTELTDAGVPQQSVQLLPYIPLILTKLGDKGVLLTEMLRPGDPRLRDPDEHRFVLARTLSEDDHPLQAAGIYMRLYPAAEDVRDVVSVNGVGDTFMGVMIAGLARGGRAEKLVDIAQRAAVMTLRSHQAVSEELGRLDKELMAAVRA